MKNCFLQKFHALVVILLVMDMASVIWPLESVLVKLEDMGLIVQVISELYQMDVCFLSFWKFLFFVSLEFDCPGDGTCSNQGTCDDTTGTCVCFQGFERISGICKGMYSMAIQVVEFSNGMYKIRKIFAKELTYSKEIIEFWELD